MVIWRPGSMNSAAPSAAIASSCRMIASSATCCRPALLRRSAPSVSRSWSMSPSMTPVKPV
jgi:hypothetical protein